MTNSSEAKKTKSIQELLKKIVQEIEDTKGLDVLILDLSGKVPYTDYFVLVTGSSDRHVQAISDRIELRLKKEDKRLAISIEGYQEAHWILMDYGDVVVHIFLPEERQYYDLESMWKDVPRLSEKKILESAL